MIGNAAAQLPTYVKERRTSGAVRETRKLMPASRLVGSVAGWSAAGTGWRRLVRLEQP